MEEINNLTQDEVLELIKDFPVEPLRNKLIITVNVENANSDLMLGNTSFFETQYVVAVGQFVNVIKPGQRVLLDLEKMMEYVTSDTDSYEKIGRLKIRPIEVNGKMFALINDSNVDAIDNRN